jgi:hypothetical protein
MGPASRWFKVNQASESSQIAQNQGKSNLFFCMGFPPIGSSATLVILAPE